MSTLKGFLPTESRLDKWLGQLGTGMMRDGTLGDLMVAANHVPKVVHKTSLGSSTMIGSACDIDLDTGKIEIIVPIGARSDEAGFARMQGLQQAKKELMRKRLQAKLAKRQGKVDGK